MNSLKTLANMTVGFCSKHLLMIYLEAVGDSTTSLLSLSASGNFSSKNLYIMGIAGPQNDLSREI